MFHSYYGVVSSLIFFIVYKSFVSMFPSSSQRPLLTQVPWPSSNAGPGRDAVCCSHHRVVVRELEDCLLSGLVPGEYPRIPVTTEVNIN